MEIIKHLYETRPQIKGIWKSDAFYPAWGYGVLHCHIMTTHGDTHSDTRALTVQACWIDAMSGEYPGDSACILLVIVMSSWFHVCPCSEKVSILHPQILRIFFFLVSKVCLWFKGGSEKNILMKSFLDHFVVPLHGNESVCNLVFHFPLFFSPHTHTQSFGVQASLRSVYFDLHVCFMSVENVFCLTSFPPSNRKSD